MQIVNIKAFINNVKVKRYSGIESQSGRYLKAQKIGEFKQTEKLFRLKNRYIFKAGIIIDGLIYRMYTTSIECRDEDAVIWHFLECIEYYLTHGVKMGNIIVFPKKVKIN